MRPKFNLDARLAATSDFSTSLTLHCSRWLELELISAFDCLVFGFSQINNAGHFECLSISCNANFGRSKVHGHASPSACHKIDFRRSRQLNYRGSPSTGQAHPMIFDNFRLLPNTERFLASKPPNWHGRSVLNSNSPHRPSTRSTPLRLTYLPRARDPDCFKIFFSSTFNFFNQIFDAFSFNLTVFSARLSKLSSHSSM